MKTVNFTYFNLNLDELFTKENDVLSRILPYCEKTDKVVTSRFYFNITNPLKFKLEIFIKKL